MTLLAANMTGWQTLLAWLTILICGLLMLVIMLQRGRGGGLAGAFGGGGGSSAFGAKTGDVFTWITVVIAVVFLLLTVVSNFAFDRSALPDQPATVTSADGTDVDGTDLNGTGEGSPSTDVGPAGTEIKTVTIGSESLTIEPSPSTDEAPAGGDPAKKQGDSGSKEPETENAAGTQDQDQKDGGVGAPPVGGAESAPGGAGEKAAEPASKPDGTPAKDDGSSGGSSGP